MKSVGDIDRPRVGMYIKFRVGSGPLESETVYGQVTAHEPNGLVRLSSGMSFSYAAGDRIFWLSGKPWVKPDSVDASARRSVAYGSRKNVTMKMAHLKKQARFATIVACVCAGLLVVALSYDGWLSPTYWAMYFGAGR